MNGVIKWYLERYATKEMILIPVGQLTIGRTMSNDVPCYISGRDLSVTSRISRLHCSIDYKFPDQLVLTDRSLNGTIINGHLTVLKSSYNLHENDQIVVGVELPETKFIVRKTVVPVKEEIIGQDDETICDIISIPDSVEDFIIPLSQRSIPDHNNYGNNNDINVVEDIEEPNLNNYIQHEKKSGPSIANENVDKVFGETKISNANKRKFYDDDIDTASSYPFKYQKRINYNKLQYQNDSCQLILRQRSNSSPCGNILYKKSIDPDLKTVNHQTLDTEQNYKSVGMITVNPVSVIGTSDFQNPVCLPVDPVVEKLSSKTPTKLVQRRHSHHYSLIHTSKKKVELEPKGKFSMGRKPQKLALVSPHHINPEAEITTTKNKATANFSILRTKQNRAKHLSKVKITEQNRAQLLANEINNDFKVPKLKPCLRAKSVNVAIKENVFTDIKKPLVSHIPTVVQYPQVKDTEDMRISSTAEHFAGFTELILNHVLQWNPLWLNKNVSADVILLGRMTLKQIPEKFLDFEEYKSVFLPFMLCDLWSHLDKGYEHMDRSTTPITLTKSKIEEKGSSRRLIITCSVNSKTSERLLSIGDLVILTAMKNDERHQSFGYVTFRRPNPTDITICIETMSENLIFTEMPTTIRKVAYIYCQMGNFHAISQLKESRLLRNILNPRYNVVFPYNNLKRYKTNEDLNREQFNAAINMYENCLNQETADVLLLDGPAGTGKTRVVTSLVYKLVQGAATTSMGPKLRILVCASSNAGIDVIVERLVGLCLTKKLNVLRFGSFSSMTKVAQAISLDTKIKELSESDREIKNHVAMLKKECNYLTGQINELLQKPDTRYTKKKINELISEKQSKLSIINQESLCLSVKNNREAKQHVMQNADVICTTLDSTYTLHRYIEKFDVCIVDEATQSLETNTLLPTLFGITKLILIGDSKQLPAIPSFLNRYNFDMSLFARIQKSMDNLKQDPIYHLNTQYRMNPEILKWPNSYFYNYGLNTITRYRDIDFPLRPYCIFDSVAERNRMQSVSHHNVDEIGVVVSMLESIVGMMPERKYSIGLVTISARQKIELETRIQPMHLRNVRVYHIDSVHGIEEDIVILSFARTLGVGSLKPEQWLNVALTRARQSLFLVGNFDNLRKFKIVDELLQDAHDRHLHFRIHEYSEIRSYLRK